MAEVDVEKVIKDLAKSYGDSNEDQGKMVALIKGLAFSDDPEANKFMKALDKWTTEYANKNVKEEVITIEEDITIGDVILEKGDKIKVLNEKQPSLDILIGDTVTNVEDKMKNWGFTEITFDSGKVIRGDIDWYIY